MVHLIESTKFLVSFLFTSEMFSVLQGNFTRSLLCQRKHGKSFPPIQSVQTMEKIFVKSITLINETGITSEFPNRLNFQISTNYMKKQ